MNASFRRASASRLESWPGLFSLKLESNRVEIWKWIRYGDNISIISIFNSNYFTFTFKENR